MRSRSGALVVFVLVFTMAVSLAGPASAGKTIFVDPRIRVFPPAADCIHVDAGTPFRIEQGFGFLRLVDDQRRPLYEFKLRVDGEWLKPDFVHNYYYGGEDPDDWVYQDWTGPARRWVFNFPDGITGTHEFHYEYWMPDPDLTYQHSYLALALTTTFTTDTCP